MNKSKKLPTIIGVLILIAGLAAGVILIKEGGSLFSRANPQETPKQVKITNITDTGFSISWLTDEPTTGLIKYSPDRSLNLTNKDDRDEVSGKVGSFITHHVTLRGLKPATAYFFTIVSGSKTYDNNGQEYQLVTAPVAKETIPENDVAYGTVTKSNGSPAEGVIVYLALANATPQSTLTKASGSWVIPLSITRSSDLSGFLNYDRTASIEDLFFQGGAGQTATAVTTTQNDSPVPAVSLGQSFDFRRNQEAQTNQEATTESSNLPLTIKNPDEGEDINAIKPEFVGTGPAGETISITVNSDQAITGKATVQSDGSWSWTPPSNLVPGDHTISITLPSGESLTRSFTVLAAGTSDLPSFTASPSATLTPISTPSPTPSPSPSAGPTPMLTAAPTPTPTLTGRTTMPSTESAIPEPGILTPTLATIIMGLVLTFIGIYGYKSATH